MNNRGITLIEVLASLTILAIVSAVVIPNIFKQVKNNKENLYESQVGIIEDSSKNWAADHTDELPNLVDGIVDVTIAQLEEGGYLEDNYENVKTGKPFPRDSYVRITCKISSQKYEYTFYFS